MMKTHDQTVSRPTPPSVAQQLNVLGPESEGLRASVSPSMTQNPTYPATVERAMTDPPALGLGSFLVPSLLHLICFGVAFRHTASRKQLARPRTPPLGPTPVFPARQRVSGGRWVGQVVCLLPAVCFLPAELKATSVPTTRCQEEAAAGAEKTLLLRPLRPECPAPLSRRGASDKLF